MLGYGYAVCDYIHMEEAMDAFQELHRSGEHDPCIAKLKDILLADSLRILAAADSSEESPEPLAPELIHRKQSFLILLPAAAVCFMVQPSELIVVRYGQFGEKPA